MIQEFFYSFEPSEHLVLWLLAAFGLAFFVSMSTFPAIFMISVKKQLMAEPGERSAHSKRTPTLGGIAIFISFVVVTTTFGAYLETKVLLLLLGGMTILFFLGLKDDLLELSPKKKFIGQIMAALVLIIFTDTRVDSFYGILGITAIPYWVSVFFSLFVFVLIINAYNLIDGVDGLAGTLTLFACAAFAYIFLDINDISIATVAVATIGSLLPFLRLNFARKRKIFMGDTGSMIVGFMMAFFVVRFISATTADALSTYANSAPVLALTIIYFPLLDTLRIFFLRIVVHKKSPFEADRNHLHHGFLDLGYSHKQTTGIVVVTNLILFLLMLLLRDIDIHLQLLLLLVLGTILYSVIFIFHWAAKKRSKQLLKREHGTEAMAEKRREERA